MTLKDAKRLRDEIKDYGYHSIVPLGRGPDGYFACIYHGDLGRIEFRDRAEFRRYQANKLRTARRESRRLAARRSRSPLDIMIDRACGLA